MRKSTRVMAIILVVVMILSLVTGFILPYLG